MGAPIVVGPLFYEARLSGASLRPLQPTSAKDRRLKRLGVPTVVAPDRPIQPPIWFSLGVWEGIHEEEKDEQEDERREKGGRGVRLDRELSMVQCRWADTTTRTHSTHLHTIARS
ncbi:hypothetical protein An04g05070 [Aspergillus niger]|uniref:Uncharacterized protein n=2 Tax=Aspergillus niger TaxID=5061 RepID=A2QIX5_ASPNC|nr:hypothetical protein An04g05070 [Aspergillus niger]CAK38769.1 hypothetical protein An04g05070 [Aspergillus niger]